jgi:hypothetical protein
LRIQRQKLRRVSVSYAQLRLKVEELAERKEAKVEAFGNVKFFQGKEEGAQKLRRGSTSHLIGRREEIWTVEDLCPGRSSEEAHRRRRPTAVGSHIEIPSAVGSGEDA